MDIREIRRNNLRTLMDREFGIAARGAQSRLADKLGKPQNFISRCLADPSRPGAKTIGEDFARDIEAVFNLPRYALDHPLPGHDPIKEALDRRTPESGFHGRDDLPLRRGNDPDDVFSGRDDFPLRDGGRSAAPRHTLAQRELLESQQKRSAADSDDFFVVMDPSESSRRDQMAPKILREKEPYKVKELEPTLIREDVQQLMKRVAPSLDVGLTATPRAGAAESVLRQLIPRRGATTASAFKATQGALFAGTKAPSNMVTLLDELLTAAESGMLTEDQVEMLIHMLRSMRLQNTPVTQKG